MATLNLFQLWINLLPDGVDRLTAYSLRGRNRKAEVDGEIQKFAGGRFRAVSEAGTKRQFDFILTQLTLTQIHQLEDWLGRGILVRTHNGQGYSGTFFAVATTEYANGLFAAGIDLGGITVTDGSVELA